MLHYRLKFISEFEMICWKVNASKCMRLDFKNQDKINISSQKFGIKINKDRTKLMTIGKQGKLVKSYPTMKVQVYSDAWNKLL